MGLQGSAQLRDLLEREGPRWEFLDGAKGDAIGFAEGAVDSAGFGHAHLSMVEDERRDIAGMGIAVAHEAAALRRFIDGGFEDPIVLFGTTQLQDRPSRDATAMVALGET